MRAIILAAGRSSRLGELTDNLPKCCLPLKSGITFLDATLNAMRHHGFVDLIVMTGHKAEVIEQAINAKWQKHFRDIKFVYNPEYLTKNNIYSAYLLREFFDDRTFLFNSDIVYDPLILKAAVDKYQDSRESFLVVDDTKPCDDEDMKVVLENGFIAAISKNLDNASALGEYIGIMHLNESDSYLFAESLVKFINEGQFTKYYEDALDAIAKQIKLSFVSTRDNIWSEVDTVEDYKRAKELFCAI